MAGHPNVFFSNPKEPLYWSKEFPRASHEPRYSSLRDYELLFERVDREKHSVVAEGSTRYIYSEIAMREILKFAPNGKFILMVRNPIELVPAYHMEMVYSFYEDVKEFGAAWSLSRKRRVGDSVPKTLSLIHI